MNDCRLYAPPSFWELQDQLRTLFDLNGCGPRGMLNLLVPDTIYGLKITQACDIHDYMYAVGTTIKDKEEADDVFRNNLIRLVLDKTTLRPLRWLRLRRVPVYYEAVAHFGGPGFWKDKNPPETLQQAT